MHEIEKLIRDILDETGVYIEDIRVSGTAGRIKVVCDTDEGIASQDLMRISKKILNDPVYDETYAADYRLEVSSPGVGTPLTLPRHFRKNTGREIELRHRDETLKDPLKGVLESADDEGIVLTVKQKKSNKHLRIPFGKIDNARVIIKW